MRYSYLNVMMIFNEKKNFRSFHFFAWKEKELLTVVKSKQTNSTAKVKNMGKREGTG